MPNIDPFPNIAKRQDACTPCGQYCCASNEVCYKDTYYYISMCSATATATVISASTETATISATFTVTTEPTYSNTSSALPITTSTSPSSTSRPSSTLTTSRPSSTLSNAATSSTTSPSPTPQPSNGLSTPAKAAIGGSVAGVSAILLFILLILSIRHWKKKRQNPRPDRPLSAPPQENSEMEELASGAGFAEARERQLSPEELQRRREQAAEEREPAAYEHSGPNPWALSGSDVAAGRRVNERDVDEEDDEEDYSELPAGAPYSADAVGNRGHVRHPGGYAPRGAYGAVRPMPPPSHYYGR